MTIATYLQALNDILRADEPELTPSIYPGWYVVKPQPRKPASCSACLDTGSTENGGPCNWCSKGD